jgi:hypothetical protein
MAEDALTWAKLFIAINVNTPASPIISAVANSDNREYVLQPSGDPIRWLISDSGTPMLSDAGTYFYYPYVVIAFDHQDPVTLDDYYRLYITGPGFIDDIRPNAIGELVTFDDDDATTVAIDSDSFVGLYDSGTGTLFQMGNDSSADGANIVSIGKMMAVT